EEKHKEDFPVNFKKRLLNHLKKLVASNKLVKVKASYKLPSTAKAVAAAKPMKEAAPAKKKPTAPAKTKAIPAKAKPASKAKPAAKAKPVPKAKPAAKPKPAPKANSPAKVARTSTRWMPGKKAQAKVAPKTSGRLITLEEIIKHFGEQLEEAAGILRASRATLKRLCGGFGVSRWPYETDKSDSLNSIFKGSNEPHFTTNITHSPVTFSKHGKHSSTPIRHQQVQTNLAEELSQRETTNRNSVTLLTIKATYGKDMVRFSFKLSDGFIKLEEQIATRFQLKLGSFKLKYTDTEGDIILIACDSSLSISVDDFRLSGGQTVIRLVVKASFKLPSPAKPKPKAPAKGKPAVKPKTAPAKPVAKTKPVAKAKLAPKAKPAAKTVKLAPAKKKPAAKPNPTPKAMPAANNSYKPARQRKRSARLISVEEISRHYGKSFEEAADILGEQPRPIALQCRGIDSPLS
ncbi:NLP3-like protein, partial [Tanacetum coccineum]